MALAGRAASRQTAGRAAARRQQAERCWAAGRAVWARDQRVIGRWLVTCFLSVDRWWLARSGRDARDPGGHCPVPQGEPAVATPRAARRWRAASAHRRYPIPDGRRLRGAATTWAVAPGAVLTAAWARRGPGGCGASSATADTGLAAGGTPAFPGRTASPVSRTAGTVSSGAVRTVAMCASGARSPAALSSRRAASWARRRPGGCAVSSPPGGAGFAAGGTPAFPDRAASPVIPRNGRRRQRRCDARQRRAVSGSLIVSVCGLLGSLPSRRRRRVVAAGRRRVRSQWNAGVPRSRRGRIGGIRRNRDRCLRHRRPRRRGTGVADRGLAARAWHLIPRRIAPLRQRRRDAEQRWRRRQFRRGEARVCGGRKRRVGQRCP